jgi:hypothetical protein
MDHFCPKIVKLHFLHGETIFLAQAECALDGGRQINRASIFFEPDSISALGISSEHINPEREFRAANQIQ